VFGGKLTSSECNLFSKSWHSCVVLSVCVYEAVLLLQMFAVMQLGTLTTCFMLSSSFHTLKWNLMIYHLELLELILILENQCTFIFLPLDATQSAVIAMASHLSVHLSVMLRCDSDHIGWNTSKIISQWSVRILQSHHHGSTPKGTPKIWA